MVQRMDQQWLATWTRNTVRGIGATVTATIQQTIPHKNNMTCAWVARDTKLLYVNRENNVRY